MEGFPIFFLTGRLQALFDYIASTLKNFVEKENKEHGLQPGRRVLGFTFSFPMKQTRISSGVLVKWTKGFAIEDMVSNRSNRIVNRQSVIDFEPIIFFIFCWLGGTFIL